MNRLGMRASLCLVASLLGAPVVCAQQSVVTPALALATFDTAWARIDRTYYDTAFLATRWKVMRDSLRPLAARATTNAELRTVLQALLSSVGVSHFGLIPSEVSPAIGDVPVVKGSGTDPGSVGASLRLAGDRVVVWKVDTGGPAWVQGIRPGTEVRRIDRTAIADAIAQLAGIEDETVRRQARLTALMRANGQLAGNVGDTVEIETQAPGGTASVRIARDPVRGQMLRFGNLPALNAIVEVSECTVPGPDGTRRIGLIAFSVWLPPVAKDIDRAFDRLRGSDGIVIDLRGNPGGVAGMVSGVAGHMLDSAYVLGTLRQRSQILRLRANPRRVSSGADPVPVTPYAGPVAILMDPLSGSTSEFFAAGMQGLGRAHVIGEISAGAALPALMDRLPNGDVMMHVIADLTDSRGRRVEGVGVVPDELVPLNPVALAAGRDDALEAALRWVATQPRPNK